MKKNQFLLLKKCENTESAQLCTVQPKSLSKSTRLCCPKTDVFLCANAEVPSCDLSLKVNLKLYSPLNLYRLMKQSHFNDAQTSLELNPVVHRVKGIIDQFFK